ncbi:MAG: hypothetical protein ACPGAN_02105 [Candidatus Poseidoniaceae archaeon]
MDEIVVRVPSSKESSIDYQKKGAILKEIWREITFGVGLWGSLRPVIAAGLALIPFLFLGQHFNRKHRKAFDFTLLQIPLILTVILWVGLYLWSIFDAWREAATNVAS